MLLWAHAGLLAARNIPIFMICGRACCGRRDQEWLQHRAADWNVAGWVRTAITKFNRMAAETAETEAVEPLAPGERGGLHCWWRRSSARRIRPRSSAPSSIRSDYPAAAVATLRRDTAARIFTDDEWGDYLIWSLYPKNRVFVDGRSDFYGDDFEDKYIDVLKVKYGWEKTLARFGVDTILLPPDAPLTGALKESSRWRVVYDDGIALVFRKNAEPRANRKFPTPARRRNRP